MKIINSKSAAATLILAASIIPAFGQSRGHGGDRGSERARSERSARPQFEQRGSPRYQPQSQQRPRSNSSYSGNAYRGDNRFGETRRYVIPQNRFYRSFGRDHFFRIGRPVFYGRYPRFQYGGFWFNFAGVAPAYWGPNWYYSDDVYIDYNDGGYYLFDNRYPGQGIPLDVDNSDASGAPPDSAYDDPY